MSEIQPYKPQSLARVEDTLKASPMVNYKKQEDQEAIKLTIIQGLLKASLMMEIEADPSFVEALAEDLMDKYSYDSVEDILFCLKKGRQGYYGKNYNKFNMIVISEWMTKHLESKAEAREKLLSKQKKNASDQATVDYKAYIERINKEKKEKKSTWISPEQRNESYIAGICAQAGITVEEIKSKTRKQHIADARMLCQYFAKHTLNWTSQKIADYWGCDDSTVRANTIKVQDEKDLQEKLNNLLENPPF